MWFVLAGAGLIATVALLDLMYSIFAAQKIADIFENVPPFNVVPESRSTAARQLTIRTADGLNLAGSLLWPDRPDPLGLVIFFPELSGNHWMARRYCDALLTEGYAILAFDFRNQGESQHAPGYSPIHWVTEFELTDVAAVMEFIESDPDLSTMPLFAFGVSRGGVAALIAGGRYPRIEAVIADSSFDTMPMARHFVERFSRYVVPQWVYSLLPEWHVERALKRGLALSERRRNCRYAHLEDEVHGLKDTPVLLISGKRDSYVSVNVARMLQQLIGPHAELWEVDKAKHNMARSTATSEYDDRVVRHFDRQSHTVAAVPAEDDESRLIPT